MLARVPKFGTAGLRSDPVTAAWKLTGDDHPYRVHTSVQCLMLLARRNLDSFTGMKNEVVMFDSEGQFAFQHVEEPTCMAVCMVAFTGAGAHEFFDNAEVWRLDKVPPVAVGPLQPAPFVMFG